MEVKHCHIRFAARTGKNNQTVSLEKYFVLSENIVRKCKLQCSKQNYRYLNDIVCLTFHFQTQCRFKIFSHNKFL